MPKQSVNRSSKIRSRVSIFSPEYSARRTMSLKLKQLSSSHSSSSTMKKLVNKILDGMKDFDSQKVKEYPGEFLCAQCSEFLFQPVTSPCGHNFCKKCASSSTTCQYCKISVHMSSFSRVNVVLNSIIEQYFPNEYSYFSLISEGDNHVDKHSLQAAVKKYTEAIDLDPGNSYAFHKRASTHYRSGRLELALADVVSAKFRNRSESKTFFWKQNLANNTVQEKAIVDQAVKIISNKIFKFQESFLEDNIYSNFEDQNSGDDPYSNKVLSELEDTFTAVLDSSISELTINIDHDTLPTLKNSETFNITDDCEKTKAFFGCALCTRLFYEPICTSCGHTFCSECLERCLDHRAACPMCQATIEDVYEYRKSPFSINWPIDSLIKKYLPKLFKERERYQEEEAEEFKKSLPLFVCIVAFPLVNTKLHVFEPRYRVMLRRAMKFNGGKFGMVTRSPTGSFNKIGTILEIKNTSFFPCGRSIVSCVGTKRFRVLEHGNCDGYNTATKMQYIKDEEENDSKVNSETQKVEKHVYKRAKEWFESRPQNFIKVTEMQYGKFPEQDHCKGDSGPDWMWWMHAIVPANDDAKIFVLSKTKVRERLSILNYILKRLDAK